MKPPTIAYLTDIYFEAGAIQLLPETLQQLKVSRPLIVTDRELASLGFASRLPIDSPEVFADVDTNPTETNVLAGLAFYRERQCDGLVALGGGSPLDCAKAIALLATHPEPLEQYAFIHGGVAKITNNQPPVIAIPTTAGTGSEVGRASLITLASGSKLAIISPHVIPNATICDPELTLTMPPKLTAATGLDAIAHCVETFCSPKFNPVADAIALDGLARAWRWVKRATETGDDLTARSEMMMAALEGGLTLQKGLGLVHALSHPLGAIQENRLHHGMLNAIFLPHVLRFHADACRTELERMAAAIEVERPEQLPDQFCELIQSVGLPLRLSEMGVTQDDLVGMAEAALRDHCCLTNPRPVDQAVCQELYDAAL